MEVYGCDLFDAPGSSKYMYTKIVNTRSGWKTIFTDTKFDYCINASGSGNVPFSVTHPVDDFYLNTLDTIHILDAIRGQAIQCRYLHISSAAVYGNPEILPVKETALCKPLSPYGWHKLMAEELCREYNVMFGVQASIFRPFSVFGPGLTKQLFWDVFTKYRENPALITLWGSGKESRDFIYIDDLAKCFHLIIEQGSGAADTYNIANGNEIMIEDAIRLFIRLLDSQCKIIFNNKAREGDPQNWKADITKIKALGFIPGISFEDGIASYINWIKQINT